MTPSEYKGTAPQTPEAPLKTSPDDWTHLDSVPDPNKVSVELTREEAEHLAVKSLTPMDAQIGSKARRSLGEGEDEPGPYAQAFREDVCPVPHLPAVRTSEAEQ